MIGEPQVAEYEELVQEHVDRLKSASGRAGVGAAGRVDEERMARMAREQLAKERNTWRLVGKLFAVKSVMDSATTAVAGGGGGEGEVRMEEDGDGSQRPLQEKILISDLMGRDETLRRAQTVVDWLEQNARDDLPEVANVYGVRSVPWRR